MAAGRLSVLDAAQTLVLHAAQPAPKVLECHLSALSGLRVPAVSPVSVQLRVRLALPADAVRAQLQQPVRHVPGGLRARAEGTEGARTHHQPVESHQPAADHRHAAQPDVRAERDRAVAIGGAAQHRPVGRHVHALGRGPEPGDPEPGPDAGHHHRGEGAGEEGTAVEARVGRAAARVPAVTARGGAARRRGADGRGRRG
uniref:(northern house mosquito) hypothetical protein n=1 Tax=Culex pipiens TaxID=7175 RepID=A0A8D8CNP3_CULPI